MAADEPKAPPGLLTAANDILEAIGAMRREVVAESREFRRELVKLSDRVEALEARFSGRGAA